MVNINTFQEAGESTNLLKKDVKEMPNITLLHPDLMLTVIY
jgi:hypothetical protein